MWPEVVGVATSGWCGYKWLVWLQVVGVDDLVNLSISYLIVGTLGGLLCDLQCYVYTHLISTAGFSFSIAHNDCSCWLQW